MEIAGKYNDRLVLMQCNTDYTGSQEIFQNIALNVLRSYAREFPDTILGLSDHTPSHSTVLGAVALGARAIEKHFTDDITRRGPDHAFSVDPSSWREMVDRSRELEAALGTEEKRVMENERETVLLQRRAVRTVRAVRVGETLTESHLVVLRPCPKDALPPFRMDEVIGRKVNRDIAQGENILLADVG
jgi:N-acetylneuraminate synthase